MLLLTRQNPPRSAAALQVAAARPSSTTYTSICNNVLSFSATRLQGGGRRGDTTSLQQCNIPRLPRRALMTLVAAGRSDADRLDPPEDLPASSDGPFTDYTLKKALQLALERSGGSPNTELADVFAALEKRDSLSERAGSMWLLVECGQWKEDHPLGWQGPARGLLQMWQIHEVGLYDYDLYELDLTGNPTRISWRSGSEMEKSTSRAKWQWYAKTFEVLRNPPHLRSKKGESTNLEGFLCEVLQDAKLWNKRLKPTKRNIEAEAAALLAARNSAGWQAGQKGRKRHTGRRSILDQQ